MNIIFIKEYIDTDTFDNVIVISAGETGLLMDDVTGKIEMTEGFYQTLQLEGVPSSYYVECD